MQSSNSCFEQMFSPFDGYNQSHPDRWLTATMGQLTIFLLISKKSSTNIQVEVDPIYLAAVTQARM